MNSSRPATNDYYYDQGECPNPKVFVEDYRLSLVLDQHGNPFVLEQKQKLGFDLKRKRND